MAKVRTAKLAHEKGVALAEETLKRRRKALAARKAALSARKGSSQADQVVAAAAMTKRFAKISSASAGLVVAEGDSWFDYPFNDILKLLEDEHGYDVESVSHRGDTVEAMAYADGQLDDFARRVENVLRSRVIPKAIILSGGGNDIAGNEFAVLLNHASSTTSGFNESILKGVIDERLFDAYVTILSAITKVCESLIGKRIPIILHGYDYAVPDGRGFAGGAWRLPGPWMEPGFRQKGYPEISARIKLIISLIDRFNGMLIRVSKQPQFSHVKYLNLRETLSNGTDYKRWWANELHPTKRGFRAVAKKMAAAIG